MRPETEVFSLRLGAQALEVGCRLGPDALVILLDLAAHSIEAEDGAVVAASYRHIGRRLGISKDTVGRRIALLRRAGLLVERAVAEADRFDAPCYVLHLDRAGVTLEQNAVPS